MPSTSVSPGGRTLAQVWWSTAQVVATSTAPATSPAFRASPRTSVSAPPTIAGPNRGTTISTLNPPTPTSPVADRPTIEGAGPRGRRQARRRDDVPAGSLDRPSGDPRDRGRERLECLEVVRAHEHVHV